MTSSNFRNILTHVVTLFDKKTLVLWSQNLWPFFPKRDVIFGQSLSFFFRSQAMQDLAQILDNNETSGQLIKTNFTNKKKGSVIEITSSEDLPMRRVSAPTIRVISSREVILEFLFQLICNTFFVSSSSSCQIILVTQLIVKERNSQRLLFPTSVSHLFLSVESTKHFIT